jgi:hypothetical protein
MNAFDEALIVELMARAPEPYLSGPIVQMYANLAAVLAGFALAGLVLYLERQPEGAPESRDAEPSVSSPGVIAQALFYSMGALITCAFLYSTLAGEPTNSGRAAIAMMTYGFVLGLAVLSLFFALTLVMLSHDVTRNVAHKARWVIVVAGPALVLRFLAAAAGDAWTLGCRGDTSPACSVWLLDPRSWGSFYIGLLVILSTILCVSWAQEVRPFAFAGTLILRWGRKWRPRHAVLRSVRASVSPTARAAGERISSWQPGRWILDTAWVRRLSAYFHHRPALPASATFVVTMAVGITSLWTKEIPSTYEPPALLADLGLIVAVLTLGLFAVAVDSVLDSSGRNHRETGHKPE